MSTDYGDKEATPFTTKYSKTSLGKLFAVMVRFTAIRLLLQIGKKQVPSPPVPRLAAQ